METDGSASVAPLQIGDFVITIDFHSLAIANEANATGNFHTAKLLLLRTKKIFP